MNTQLKDLQMQIDKELKQKKMLNKFNQDFQKLVLDKGRTYKGYAQYYKTLFILWVVIATQMAIIILFLTDILQEDQLAKKVMLYELDKASNTVKPYCLTSNQFIDTQTDLLLFADKETALKYNQHLKENKE